MIEKLSRESQMFEDALQIILNAMLDGVIISRVGPRVCGGCEEKEGLGERADCCPAFPIQCVNGEAEQTGGFCFERNGKYFHASVVKFIDSRVAECERKEGLGRDGTSRIVTIIRDTTSIRRLQHQLEQSQRMEALGQMTSGVAHDLNNVLSAILGRVQLLQQNLHDQQALESGLRIIEKAALDATETIKQIQQFTSRVADCEEGH